MYTYKCKVKRIVDGDTLVLEYIDLGFGIQLKDLRVRLLNYNAPESKGIEKEFGKIAKAALENLLSLNSEITIKTTKEDSFGRYLADIYVDGLHINEELVKRGYGYAWNGKGDRPSFDPKGKYPLV